MIYTYETLPVYDNLNRFSFAVEVSETFFIRKGSMIAYYGNLRFEAVGKSVLDMVVQHSFNAPLHANSFVTVNGQGKLVLGDNYNDINSFDLTDGILTIKSGHVLGFDSHLVCRESIVPGYLTLLGTGRFIASSCSPVFFLEPPCRVDERALLGWADMPCPYFYYDYSYIRSIASMLGSVTGLTSTGEEKQVDFTGKGTVLIQSQETMPTLK